MKGIIRAWGLILRGYSPSLSIEITKECPLRCPGCYAYGDEHLGGTQRLRDMSDHKGQDLVDGVLALVDAEHTLHLSIIGGEPLVRYRELNQLLPQIAARGIYTQVVTSAVRPIPREWAGLRRLHLVVSVDGLQPEHDARRAPATYDRLVKHIEGHSVTIHCTVTRQQTRREGYLDRFAAQWSANPNVRNIWFSLYTPQVGEVSDEMLTPEDRQRVVGELLVLQDRYPKVHMPKSVSRAYLSPPTSPDDCTFARTTMCLTTDLSTRITPCQLGGRPDCAQCGCIASAGLTAVDRHELLPGLRLREIFDWSSRVGAAARRGRERRRARRGGTTPALGVDRART